MNAPLLSEFRQRLLPALDVARREARALRNRLVHEYFEDPAALAAALTEATAFTPVLLGTLDRMRGRVLGEAAGDG